MRIISGTLKGKKINFIKNSNTRPLKDVVRENIFNILKHSNKLGIKVENSNILDLYSGIGSFGLEALSRNAKKVTFVEKDQIASNILKDNLVNLSLIAKSEIYTDTIENIIKNKMNDKYNIFFLDPPFSDLKFNNDLELLKKNKAFKLNHIIIIHRERKTKDAFKNLIKTILIKEYGRSKIIFAKFN